MSEPNAQMSVPAEAFADILLRWYRQNRRILPWREEVSPYRTWISEIMLQQTRVEAVKGYFDRFLSVLPTVYELASVPDEILMKLWQGLGYYSRARNLKKAAMEIVSLHGGEIPTDFHTLLSLPGIGPYTAGAIASIAFGKREPAVDGNVLRVYARVFGDRRDISEAETKTEYENAVRVLMPQESGKYVDGRNDCGDFTQGMIELGATVCLPVGEPLCERCPFAEFCAAKRENAWRELPVKKKKAVRRIEDRTVLLLLCEDRFALTRRPERGLLAGLFEPVNLAGKLSEEEIRSALSEMGFSNEDVGEPVFLGETKHIFTHVEWHMRGYLVTLGSENCRAPLIFLTAEKIAAEYAVPSAFRFFTEWIERIGNGKKEQRSDGLS